MSGHFVNKCVHGIVMGQCRCPAPDKTVRTVPCNHQTTFERLTEANTKTLDSMVLEGATDEGAPFAYPKTPGEFAARWNKWSPEHRQEWLDDAIRCAEIAQRVQPLIRRSD